MEQFQLEVVCNAGGTPHKHVIVVEHASGAFGASRPGNVRLQYTCPVNGEAHVATFQPPVGAKRPFAVTSVQ
jgi:hypothetical protein